jgi:hypothetical protein
LGLILPVPGGLIEPTQASGNASVATGNLT